MNNILRITIYSLLVLVSSCNSSTNTENKNPINQSLTASELKSIRIDSSLHIAINDIDPMTWYDAIKLINNIGNGWRLPSKEEFDIIKSNEPTLSQKTNIYKGGYWTSSELDKENAWQSSFEFGYLCEYYSKNQFARIFLVKSPISNK